MGLGALAVLGLVVFLVTRFMGAAQVTSIEPARARIGQTVVLTGTGFASEPQSNVVTFGDKPGTVVKATPSQLEVLVPEVVTAPGQDVRIPVRVRAGKGESRPVELAVFAGPTLHGISPDVAMPGDEVVLAGAGWRLGAAVRFGAQAAEVLDVKETSIRVRVPPILGGPGTFAPAVVAVGGGESNPAPFYIGRVPLVLKVEPPSGATGDVVAIHGRGFQRDVLRNAVLIAGARALIVSALDDESWCRACPWGRRRGPSRCASPAPRTWARPPCRSPRRPRWPTSASWPSPSTPPTARRTPSSPPPSVPPSCSRLPGGGARPTGPWRGSAA
jgi:hypothetical protein